MPVNLERRSTLSSVGFGSLYSYELSGEHIVGRLFGIFPAKRIHLAAVHYLRLAIRSETPPVFLAFNWIHFLPHRRAICPVYVLQTRSHHRIFLKLESGAHFRLRQAISRHAVSSARLAA